MKEQLEDILKEAQRTQSEITTKPQFEAYKAQFMGANGSFTKAMKSMGSLPPDQKPIVGKLINDTKKSLESIFTELFNTIESNEIFQKIGGSIDPSLPNIIGEVSKRHPLQQVREKIINVFQKIGFVTVSGPEIDTEWYCFDSLNLPSDHPARAEQDTYYFPSKTLIENLPLKKDEKYLLRAHTSTVQIRTMLSRKPPIRIISPGRAFRRDNPDATHSANFHQIEGLYVDCNVSIKDLKATIDFFLEEIFGNSIETRFRPSYFPYTEPSYEVDLKSPHLGKLKNTWIEIMGCGIVDPIVFENVHYDSRCVSGFAFGIGIERIAMLLHGIDDIRHFYQNDMRFLNQF